jgi:tetratricopeptide (TPR) repeat protein
LGVIAAYRIGALLGSGPAGVLAALFLILTPRYYGHAFNNPKDIPFAVFYLWSIYWIARDISKLPNLPRNWIWKTGLAIGLTLACRINGIILFAYMGLFFGIRYIQLFKQGHDLQRLIRSYITQILSVALIAYIIMLPFWPWGLLNPLTGPYRAIDYFSQFIEPHYSYFNGQYLANTELPYSYVTKWLLLTLPEFALTGIIAALVTFALAPSLQLGLIAFSAFFPIVYAAIMHTPFYDGYRHALFVVPPLIVFSAIGTVQIIARLRPQRIRNIATLITCSLMLWTLIYMIRLHPNQNVYFNHLIAGGIQNASKNYETDYWGNSYKQGLEWIEENYNWDFSKRKLKIASFFGQLHNVMNSDRFERIEEFEQADLLLGTTRFDHHRIIPGEIVHTIRADSTPILYIIRPDPRYQNDPFFAESPFRRIYLDLKFQSSQNETDTQAFLDQVKTYNLESFVAGSYNNQALDYHQSGEYDKAIVLYKQALNYHSNHLITWYNLAQTYHVQSNIIEAIAAYEKAIQLNAARIMDAKAVRTLYYNLGECYHQTEQLDAAEKAYQNALKREPESPDILNNLAALYIQRENFETARDILQPLVSAHPERNNLRLNLAIALANTGNLDEARIHAQEALKREPDNPGVQALMKALGTDPPAP